MIRYVLIGSGVASMAAAQAIRNEDTVGEIIMVSADPHGFYSRPGLAYYLSGEIPNQQLFPEWQRAWLRSNVKYIKSHIIGIDPVVHAIETDRHEKVAYDRLLIATGSEAVPMKVPGAELPEVVKLDDYGDAQRIKDLVRKVKSAVVVGGGITALELVESLLSFHIKVHFLLRGDRFWGNILDLEESDLIERKLIREGVEIHTHTEVQAIVDKRGHVHGVLTKKGESLKCQLVAYAVGIRPKMELAKLAGLNLDKGILVNEYLETNQDHIYAAGDVAQVFDPLTGQAILDSLWNPAREQGRIAGMNMAGQRVIYLKEIAYNVTRLAGVTTTIIGMLGGSREEQDLVDIARGESETFRKLPNAIAMTTGSEINQVRVMIGDNTLVGALVMGDQTLSRPLKELILNQVEITAVRSRLIQPSSPVGDILMDQWITWKNSPALG